MHLSTFLFIGASLTELVTAARGGAGYDTSRLGPSNAICRRKTYIVSAQANNSVYEAPLLPNISESIMSRVWIDHLVSHLTSSSASNFSDSYVGKTKKLVSGAYAISGTLCTPKKGAKNASHVQLLIHGIGFDSSYWDFSPSEEYSYVRASAAAGISTFRYDRLGTGLSEKPADSYAIVQSPLELAIAQKFASMLRAGKIGNTKFTKIVGVGHSYGAIQIQALSATVPSALDGVILQGFSVNATAIPLTIAGGAYAIATDVFPERFSASELTNSYVATLGPQTNKFAFWHYPGYTEQAFQRAWDTEQPNPQASFLSLTDTTQPAATFTGPVHVVTGDKDFIVCLADCYAVPDGSGKSSILDFVELYYPATRNFSTYIPANTGHAVNGHISAPQTYKNMLAFVENVFGQ
ncbi:hypothetical protein HWV62_24690 [Athelia sp. TMB]|nr:hypothetical protein HWV62_24690 [Athelia sp. TMB]